MELDIRMSNPQSFHAHCAEAYVFSPGNILYLRGKPKSRRKKNSTRTAKKKQTKKRGGEDLLRFILLLHAGRNFDRELGRARVHKRQNFRKRIYLILLRRWRMHYHISRPRVGIREQGDLRRASPPNKHARRAARSKLRPSAKRQNAK